MCSYSKSRSKLLAACLLKAGGSLRHVERKCVVSVDAKLPVDFTQVRFLLFEGCREYMLVSKMLHL